VSRVTYLTPEQETAMRAVVSRAFAVALQVCIRTGATFGSEFARLEAKHVRDHGDRMEWVFNAEAVNNKKLRIIRVTDPQIIRLVRERIQRHPSGPLFRNRQGKPWTPGMLSQNFRRGKAKVGGLDDDACMYSCRHTYAKRTLEGYWTGEPTSIKTLARLMGNTVQVCIDHYLQFSEADNDGLWAAT
jgi:integrase